MDKVLEPTNIHHQISISERKNIVLTGVKKIISFDNEEFLMEGNMGNILLRGEELEIIKLDTHIGNVSIKGLINSLTYLDSKEKTKENSIISKLFK